MDVPALDFTKARAREFSSYSEEVRASVVYLFLVEGMATRRIDVELGLMPSIDTKGFQSMNICHYLGLRRAHQGLFRGKSASEVITELTALSSDPAWFLILHYVAMHLQKTASISETDGKGKVVMSKNWIRSTLVPELSRSQLDEALVDFSRCHLTKSQRTVYDSSAVLKERVKSLYDYRCQVCGDVILCTGWTPGQTRTLEWMHLSNDAHHILPLSKGGSDSASNMLCLCPSCHRKFHSGQYRLRDKGGLVLCDELRGNLASLVTLRHKIVLE